MTMPATIPTATQLANLFHAQQKLDDKIEKKLPRRKGEDRLELKILALITEVSEALNEFREFKFWSEDRERRNSKLVEELVDILHFLLSIGIETGHTELEIFTFRGAKNGVQAFGEMYLKASSLLFTRRYDIDIDIPIIEVTFAAYYQLIEQLGFTWSDIEQAYNQKNEKNHTRQETAY